MCVCMRGKENESKYNILKYKENNYLWQIYMCVRVMYLRVYGCIFEFNLSRRITNNTQSILEIE